MRHIIDALRKEKIKVTIYDHGTERVDFVLAVVIDEPIDIWYVSSIIGRTEVLPFMDGQYLFFPSLKIDTDTYDYICAQD